MHIQIEVLIKIHFIYRREKLICYHRKISARIHFLSFAKKDFSGESIQLERKVRAKHRKCPEAVFRDNISI